MFYLMFTRDFWESGKCSVLRPFPLSLTGPGGYSQLWYSIADFIPQSGTKNLDSGLGPWRSMFIFHLNMPFMCKTYFRFRIGPKIGDSFLQKGSRTDLLRALLSSPNKIISFAVIRREIEMARKMEMTSKIEMARKMETARVRVRVG